MLSGAKQWHCCNGYSALDGIFPWMGIYFIYHHISTVTLSLVGSCLNTGKPVDCMKLSKGPDSNIVMIIFPHGSQGLGMPQLISIGLCFLLGTLQKPSNFIPLLRGVFLKVKIRLMEQLLHHLGCIKPCKEGDELPTSTGGCRISEPSTVCKNSSISPAFFVTWLETLFLIWDFLLYSHDFC